MTYASVVNATYTTENQSYYGALLHLQRATGESRFPLYDEIGTARGLVDAAGTVTDTYDMDTFGSLLSSTGATPNPYRYGAAWGYITDPSGLLQLGHRFYWPEIGRFAQRDPLQDDVNFYLYGRSNPLVGIDPQGLSMKGAVGTGTACGAGVAVAGSILAGAEVVVALRDIHEAGQDMRAENEQRMCAGMDRPFGQTHGPWNVEYTEAVSNKKRSFQCWHAPRPCPGDDSDEGNAAEKPIKTCIRYKKKNGWTDWICRDVPVANSGMGQYGY